MCLKAIGLTKSYKNRKVVDSVNLELQLGEVVGLLGPNGAGKTTTFYMILGLTKPDAGRVYLDGQDISKLPMYKRAGLGIGYLSQEPSIFRKLTVEENLSLILEFVEASKEERQRRIDELLQEFGLIELRHHKGYVLSGGERRRVELARTLATKPAFLLLDEPFTGIDPKTVAELQALIKTLSQQNIGMLITDHNVRETLAITDRSYIIHQGKILREGLAEELVEDPLVRQFYLGEQFRL